MTPQEKAIELLEKLIPHVYNEYDGSDGGRDFNAKRHTIQCALIVVNEILLGYMGNPKVKYWTEVKQELEKL
jgi:hypothetical protein